MKNMYMFVKPCISCDKYLGIIPQMEKFKNCILGCNFIKNSSYKDTLIGWYWDINAIVILDTEEKFNIFKKVASKIYK